MSRLQPPTAALPQPVPPACVQPGGGLGMRLELAWGRLRRALLRRFRPGYVRLMQEKRQGQCDGCPHDIIDPRDLKFWRNVCGYWFRPEDDRFRWRGRLGLARAGLAEVLIFTTLFLGAAAALLSLGWLVHPAFGWAVAVPALLWLEVIYFFRDPERTP